MKFKDFINAAFVRYAAKFLLLFCVLYYGTTAVIALASPGGQYSAFVQNYLDYPGWLRASLLNGAQMLLSVMGYPCSIVGPYHLVLANGNSVQLVYSCLGYGLMSFWAAFVIANSGSIKKKVAWIIGGFCMLWLINVIRIALLLASIHQDWPVPFGLNHHTLFNIAAYLLIFIMIWFFDRSQKKGPVSA